MAGPPDPTDRDDGARRRADLPAYRGPPPDDTATRTASRATVRRARSWREGETIGRYRVRRVLGQGGMGAVYEVEADGARYALKVLLALDDGAALARFAREGQAQAAIPPHPNVLGVHAAGQVEGVPYLLMELAPNGDLKGRLEAGPLPALEVARLGGELARALSHVHAHGVLHRDLKPHNVVFGEDGAPTRPGPGPRPRAPGRGGLLRRPPPGLLRAVRRGQGVPGRARPGAADRGRVGLGGRRRRAWGKEADERRANTLHGLVKGDKRRGIPPQLDPIDGHRLTSPVDAHPEGASRWGSLGMAGNVFEWVDGPPGHCWCMGGSWLKPFVKDGMTGLICNDNPGQFYEDTGFRAAWRPGVPTR